MSDLREFCLGAVYYLVTAGSDDVPLHDRAATLSDILARVRNNYLNVTKEKIIKSLEILVNDGFFTKERLSSDTIYRLTDKGEKELERLFR
ncbi:hypothetical protein [Bombella apis]|uniref:ArnR1-like winged helix-turn-helix domain-containing protein n=1 Tax=Bombella apis TaxID=1785988 RepID=A0ABR9MMW4_9PROT|nr:hypothetical protein [Bombella apis]MBE1723187.1 hypothetical protein [Bombella apis]MBR9730994.1 hypothetical protein [Bombella apis]